MLIGKWQQPLGNVSPNVYEMKNTAEQPILVS